jgi:hypothetical protein
MSESATTAAPAAQQGGQSAAGEIAATLDSMFNADGTRNPAYFSAATQDRLASLLSGSSGAAPAPAPSPTAGAPAPAAEAALGGFYASAHSYDLGELAGDPGSEAFAATLAAAEFPQELVHAMLSDDGQDHTAADQADRQQVEAELRNAWGGQYSTRVDGIKRYLANNLPAGVFDKLLNARIGGKALLNHSTIVMELAAIAERSPRFVSTGDRERDIAAIESLMAQDPKAYQQDVGLQLRLRSLYGSRPARE